MSLKARSARARATATLGVVAVAVLGLGACGDGGGVSGGGTGSAPSGAAADITWLGFVPGPPLTDDFIADFNEENPDISVTWKQTSVGDYNSSLRTALAAPRGTDVFQIGPGSANGGAAIFGSSAKDLTADVEKALGSDWKSKLSPIGVDPLTIDGKLTGLSGGAVFAGNLWINKDMFDEFGIQPPTTYDEWKDVCQKLESHGKGCFVQGAGAGAFNIDTVHTIADLIEPGLFNQAITGDITWTDPRIIQAFGLWKQLFDDGIMQEGALGQQQFPDASNAFMAQDYGMIMMGTWYAQNLVPEAMTAAMEAAGVTDPTPFTMYPIPFPDMVGDGNTGTMFGDSDWGLAVRAGGQNEAAATSFAVWLGTTKAGQQAIANSLNMLPALNGITPDWNVVKLVNADEQQAAFEDLMDRSAASTYSRFGLIPADVEVALEAATQQVADGSKTPDQACADVQAAADAA